MGAARAGISGDLAARYSAQNMAQVEGALSESQVRDCYFLLCELVRASQAAHHAALIALGEVQCTKNTVAASEAVEWMRGHLSAVKNSLVAVGGVVNAKQIEGRG